MRFTRRIWLGAALACLLAPGPALAEGGAGPTVFAAAYTIFPREKQPVVGPMIGLVATLAPTIGPTVGGYLTDLFS